MTDYKLAIVLKSDATFGRGDGVAGLVDTEVEHDAHGMPYLHGRTLKGLLSEACADILFALRDQAPQWEPCAQRLFGRPGSSLDDQAIMRVGNAQLPADLRVAVKTDIKANRYQSSEMLDSLTAIRYQTAMDETGKPEKGTLRTRRVILRETAFEADVSFQEPAKEDDIALLAACAMAVRRLGTERNRGSGRVVVRLQDENGRDVTDDFFTRFEEGLL